jgi:DUF971 family protein
LTWTAAARTVTDNTWTNVRPENIQQIGGELAIKWEDGTESFVKLELMRRHCPCASCHGETDVMGNVYKGPVKPYAANAFTLLRLNNVGGYAINPVWADAHSTGIYSFDYLKRLGEMNES